MNGIHALGASVSMASGGAKAVDGGNFLIFENMVRDSKATLHLGTEVSQFRCPLNPAEYGQVKDIVPLGSESGAPSFRVITNSSRIDNEQPFDQIFYAAPWYLSPKDKGMHTLSQHLLEPMP